MANPLVPSFRYIAEVPEDAAHPSVRKALTQHTKGLVDLNQAIVALKQQVGGTNTTTTVVEKVGGGGGGGTDPAGPPGPPGPAGAGAPPGLGGLNNQTGNASYTTAMTDSGILIVFNRAGGTTVTLNSGVSIPFFFFATNLGTTGNAVFIPSSGLVNGAASFTLGPLRTAEVVFDGTNWTVTALPAAITFQTNGVNNGSQIKLNLVAGTNITIVDDGVGGITISSTGTGSNTFTPRAKTANYTAVANDAVFCDTSGGGFTVTLPAAASNAGATIDVKKMSSDGNNLTIARTGGDLIDGATSQVTPLPFSSYTFVSDGVSNWGIF